MDYQIINKYLGGKATEEEVADIYKWIESSSDNQTEFVEYKKVWALTERCKLNTATAWPMVEQFTTRKHRRKMTLRKVMQYAASIIVLIGLGMGTQCVLNNNNIAYADATTIEAPNGQMTSVNLPDGTSVLLNSGSRLSYSNHYSEGDRTINLIGEAYFDVAKDAEHPFIVQTLSIDLRVYGTSFNVEAYPDDLEINTTLVEGSLGVMNKQGKEIVRLVPGQNANYKKRTSQLKITKVNTDFYSSWKDGVVSFRNAHLEDLVHKMERMYDVEIIIRNTGLKRELYRGSILRNKPIEQFLEVLQKTTSIEYQTVTRADQPMLIYLD